MAGGSILAQALSIVTSPITTRLYSPSDYGMAAVFNSVLGVLLLFSTWRYEMAITLPQDEEDSCAVLWTCLFLACVASLTAVPLALLAGKWLFTSLGAPNLYRYWWMLPPTILGASLYQCFSIWTLRRKDYFTLTGTKLRQAAAGSVVSIGMGCFWKGPLGLLLGSFCSMSLGVGRLGRGTIKRGLAAGGVALERRIRAALRTYGRFAFFTTSATLLNNAGILITPMLISAFYSEEAVGHFGLAQRMVSLPGAVIGTAVAQVFIGEASEMLRERPEELGAFFKKVARKLAPLALGLLALGAACPWIFPLVFGARWKTAGVFAALLSVLAAAQLIVSPFECISVLRQRQDIQFALGALRSLVVIGTIWLPAHLGKGALVAVGCYTLGMSVVNGVAYVVYSRLAGTSVCAKREVAPVS